MTGAVEAREELQLAHGPELGESRAQHALSGRGGQERGEGNPFAVRGAVE